MIADIVAKTGGKLFRVFDAVAQNIQFSVPMFNAIPEGTKYFTSTNDWYDIAQVLPLNQCDPQADV